MLETLTIVTLIHTTFIGEHVNSILPGKWKISDSRSQPTATIQKEHATANKILNYGGTKRGIWNPAYKKHRNLKKIRNLPTIVQLRKDTILLPLSLTKSRDTIKANTLLRPETKTAFSLKNLHTKYIVKDLTNRAIHVLLTSISKRTQKLVKS